MRLLPGRQHIWITERHQMPRGSAWEFELTHGWDATAADVIPWASGFDRWKKDEKDFPPTGLVPGQTRMGDCLLNLQARWSQAYDDGW